MPTPISSLAALDIIAPVITGDTLSIDSTVLPYTVTGDVNTIHLEILIYNTTLYNDSPVLVSGAQEFTGSIPIDPTVQQTILQFLGRNYSPANNWAAGTAFAIGYRFADPNGNVQVCITAGISGSTQPVWNTTVNGVTNDTLLGGTLQWQNIGAIAVSPISRVTLIYFNTQDALVIGPPTGIRIYNGQSSAKIEWVQPPYEGTIGVRVMISTDPTGVNVPFVQYGDLVNDITRTAVVTTASTTSTVQTENTQTITTVNSIENVNFASVIIPQTAVNASEFYALLSTVIQDSGTNAIYESQQVGPIAAGFVDLHVVNPSDFLPLARKEDIAGRAISQVTRRYPDLDLTPRSELRDLAIDPFALEVSNMNVREWFARCAQSISAISQIDNASGNGISDPFDSSSVKQSISRAFGLNAADTQSFIDKQFDTLGEEAGVTRGGTLPAVVTLTFYTYVQPQASVTIPVGALAATVPDAETPALNFITTGSATLSTSSLPSFYDPVNGWWALSVPAMCQTSGSIGNVGARTIRNPLSNVPQGWNVTNQLAAQFGEDEQTNADFAAVIRNRQVVGIDSSTAPGYEIAAQETPGISEVKVVGAGDLEMLRDWDPIRQKHVFGTVDIYVRGSNVSEEDEDLPFVYNNTGTFGQTTSYLTLTLQDPSILKFAIGGFANLPYPLYTGLELRVSRASNSFYLDLTRAQFDNTNGTIILNPNDMAYQYVGDTITKAQIPLTLNSVPATNRAAIQALASAQGGTYVYQLIAREESPLLLVPTLQPVQQVNSIQGPQTGVVAASVTRLIRVNDFLLTGGSNNAGDEVAVNSTTSLATTTTITALTANAVQIDTAMDIPVDSNGVPQNVLSVRSTDLSTLYQFNVDYAIVPLGKYHAYGLQLLTGSAIANLQQVVVGYNKFLLYERLSFISNEQQTLNSNIPVALDNEGFVHNTWLPESYGRTDLTLNSAPVYNADGSLNPVLSAGLIQALVPHDSRYVLVTYNNGITTITMRENIDFSLTVDPVSGAATIARILTGAIPDGVVVLVSYFVTEVFTIATQYPAYVQILANTIALTKAAAADVLVKAMLANPVDLTFTVTLAANAQAAAVDAIIRTNVSIALSNADESIDQAEIIRQIMASTGVSNVGVPLIKMAKSDGSYDIDFIIPTNTQWAPLASDPTFSNLNLPQNSFISPIVLPDATIPGGGLPDSFVGLLYEGQEFQRTNSVQAFLNSSVPSFYIIGTNDQVNATIPLPTATYAQRVLLTEGAGINPLLRAYRVTYQVFGEGGAKDITTSSTEYLVPGRITINYITTGS